MAFDFRKLQNLKQALLIVSILYFYGMAIAISFNRDTYGLDSPAALFVVGLLFVIAIVLEAGMVWWHRRKRVTWGILLTTIYALLGFVIAPKVYGDWVLTAALFLPVVVVFIVGFAFSYSRILVRSFTPNMRLSFDQITDALKSLPGWEYAANRLEKTYRFATYGESLEFVNAVGVIAQKMHHIPEVDLRKNSVKLRLTSPDVGGVSQRDVDIAKEFDKV
jgi:4a-hydroxytetrahydrobiopterin dehydratase